MKKNFYDKKMLIAAFAVLVFFFVCYAEQTVLKQNTEKNSGNNKPTVIYTQAPTKTSTPKPMASNASKDTPEPSINDVELYFNDKSIEITSKEQKETAMLYLYRKGFKGTVGFETEVTGNGAFDFECSEWKTLQTGVYIKNIDFFGLKNGTSYLTMSVKGTSIKTTLEIIINIPVTENILYEDEYVKICFDKIGERGVDFLVENKTDFLLTIQADAVAINGYSTDDITMSDNVAPRSKGKVIARCDCFAQETEVAAVSGQLRVIDFSGELLKHSYDAKFVNVEVE